jgi:xanthine/uracil permease
MLAGHFTTALVANQKFPKGTLLYFLIVSQFQDLLWFSLHYFGLEVTGPSDVFNTTLSTLVVDMLYSHDLLPQIFWLVFIFLLGKGLFKSTKIGFAGSALVAAHFVLDIFSGHPHHIFGADSQDIALGLYASNVYLAIAIEVVFCIVMLWYFFKKEAENGNIRTPKNKASIIGLFVFGIVFMLSIATISFREWLSLPEFSYGFNSNVPTLILTYIAMIAYLNVVVSKFKVGHKF